MRVLLALSLLSIAAVCAYGLLATFEPMDEGRRLAWRMIYGLGLVTAALGVAWFVRASFYADAGARADVRKGGDAR